VSSINLHFCSACITVLRNWCSLNFAIRWHITVHFSRTSRSLKTNPLKCRNSPTADVTWWKVYVIVIITIITPFSVNRFFFPGNKDLRLYKFSEMAVIFNASCWSCSRSSSNNKPGASGQPWRNLPLSSLCLASPCHFMWKVRKGERRDCPLSQAFWSPKYATVVTSVLR